MEFSLNENGKSSLFEFTVDPPLPLCHNWNHLNCNCLDSNSLVHSVCSNLIGTRAVGHLSYSNWHYSWRNSQRNWLSTKVSMILCVCVCLIHILSIGVSSWTNKVYFFSILTPNHFAFHIIVRYRVAWHRLKCESSLKNLLFTCVLLKIYSKGKSPL